MDLKYFSERGDKNIACQCGCGLGWNEMAEDFMEMIDNARYMAGVPFSITSGIRCPEHNNKVSGSGYRGPHTTGRALDIAVPNSRARFLILKALIDCGFTRIGIAKSFIHVDDARGSDSRVSWVY